MAPRSERPQRPGDATDAAAAADAAADAAAAAAAAEAAEEADMDAHAVYLWDGTRIDPSPAQRLLIAYVAKQRAEEAEKAEKARLRQRREPGYEYFYRNLKSARPAGQAAAAGPAPPQYRQVGRDCYGNPRPVDPYDRPGGVYEAMGYVPDPKPIYPFPRSWPALPPSPAAPPFPRAPAQHQEWHSRHLSRSSCRGGRREQEMEEMEEEMEEEEETEEEEEDMEMEEETWEGMEEEMEQDAAENGEYVAAPGARTPHEAPSWPVARIAFLCLILLVSILSLGVARSLYKRTHPNPSLATHIPRWPDTESPTGSDRHWWRNIDGVSVADDMSDVRGGTGYPINWHSTVRLAAEWAAADEQDAADEWAAADEWDAADDRDAADDMSAADQVKPDHITDSNDGQAADGATFGNTPVTGTMIDGITTAGIASPPDRAQLAGNGFVHAATSSREPAADRGEAGGSATAVVGQRELLGYRKTGANIGTADAVETGHGPTESGVADAAAADPLAHNSPDAASAALDGIVGAFEAFTPRGSIFGRAPAADHSESVPWPTTAGFLTSSMLDFVRLEHLAQDLCGSLSFHSRPGAVVPWREDLAADCTGAVDLLHTVQTLWIDVHRDAGVWWVPRAALGARAMRKAVGAVGALGDEREPSRPEEGQVLKTTKGGLARWRKRATAAFGFAKPSFSDDRRPLARTPGMLSVLIAGAEGLRDDACALSDVTDTAQTPAVQLRRAMDQLGSGLPDLISRMHALPEDAIIPNTAAVEAATTAAHEIEARGVPRLRWYANTYLNLLLSGPAAACRQVAPPLDALRALRSQTGSDGSQLVPLPQPDEVRDKLDSLVERLEIRAEEIKKEYDSVHMPVDDAVVLARRTRLAG